jgi:site-specific DNA-methyltransferase (adenine-specific)
MEGLPDKCTDLIVTSPPYNCGKEYEENMTDREYRLFLAPIFQQFKRILKPDGRFCINTAFNMNRWVDNTKEVVYPFLAIVDELRIAGLQIKEDVIWDQCNSGCETAWGSWQSASSPHIRHLIEHIIVGHNEVWGKTTKGETDINPKEFMLFTIDKWRFPPTREVKGHPAPFPIELPYRCIKLFSYVGDVVLDPFLGSGTTLLACRHTKRVGIGFEINPDYETIIKKHAKTELPKLSFFDERLEDFSPPFEASSRQGVGPAQKPDTDGLGSVKGMHCQSDKHPSDCCDPTGKATVRAVRDNQLDRVTLKQGGGR